MRGPGGSECGGGPLTAAHTAASPRCGVTRRGGASGAGASSLRAVVALALVAAACGLRSPPPPSPCGPNVVNGVSHAGSYTAQLVAAGNVTVTGCGNVVTGTNLVVNGSDIVVSGDRDTVASNKVGGLFVVHGTNLFVTGNAAATGNLFVNGTNLVVRNTTSTAGSIIGAPRVLPRTLNILRVTRCLQSRTRPVTPSSTPPCRICCTSRGRATQ